MADDWLARYPDLRGKTVLVGGHDPLTVLAVTRCLIASGCFVGLVCADRATVDRCTTAADAANLAVYGLAADPADPAVWGRVVPHVEQRLGPVDAAVAMGEPAARRALLAAVAADMHARRRGTVVEVGAEPVAAERPPHHRHVSGAEPRSVAAAVAFCASDVVPARWLRVQLA